MEFVSDPARIGQKQVEADGVLSLAIGQHEPQVYDHIFF